MQSDTQRGYSLLELSMVLVLIGVIASMGFSSGSAVLLTARENQTTAKLLAIKQALMAHRKAWNRLPCPSSLTLATTSLNFGVEGPYSSSCMDGTAGNATATNLTTDTTVAEGAVPTRTLGLPDDFAFDGWGNRIRYALSTAYAVPNSFLTHGISARCDASIGVLDGNGASSYRTQMGLYVLLSHGANRHGAYNRVGMLSNLSATVESDEQQNCHCNSSGPTTYDGKYVIKASTQNATDSANSFDDQATYAMRWQMQTSSDKLAGCINVYATDPGNNRVEAFSPTGAFVRSIGAGYNGVSGAPGSSGSGNGQFNLPYDAAVTSDGNIWVVDQGNQRVEEFDESGTFIRSIGGGGIYTDGSFYYPNGVTVDKQDNVWVTDNGNHRVQEFTSGGNWLRTVPSGCPNTSAPACAPSAATGHFNGPSYVTSDANGNIWVNDAGNVRAQELSNSGAWMQSIPASGSFGCQTATSPACPLDYTNNPMTHAGKIALDSSGNMWTADLFGQIDKTSLTTGLITNIYSNIYVSNLAIDSSGNVWGGLTGTNLQVYNSSGTLVYTYGSQGNGNGQFGYTYFPISLVITGR